MSAWRTNLANTSRAPGCFRLSVTPYLPRSLFRAETDTSSGCVRPSDTPSRPRYGGFCRHGSGDSRFSILMTRAPRPARRNVANGPASASVRSSTVRPVSGPCDGVVSPDIVGPECTGRAPEGLRLSGPARETCDVFPARHRLTDKIDEGAHERRGVACLPGDDNRHRRDGVVSERLENDAGRQQRADRVGEQSESKPFLHELEMAEHIVGARDGLHPDACLPVE